LKAWERNKLAETDGFHRSATKSRRRIAMGARHDNDREDA